MGRPLRSIKPMFQRDKWRIVRGDLVQIIAGKCKGEQGTVLRVIRDERRPRVVVEGQNLTRRRFPARNGQPGFPVTMESPLHYSNVMLVDPVQPSKRKADKGKKIPVRCKYAFDANGYKLRISHGRRASGTVIGQPDAWKAEASGDLRVGEKDTPSAAALKVTFNPSSDFSDFSAGWPAAGSHKGAQQRSFSTASTSSIGHARGFAASAAEVAGCSYDGAHGADGRQARSRASDAGSSAAGALLAQHTYNPVLQLVRRMHYSSSSCDEDSLLGAQQQSVVETSSLASEVREEAPETGGWSAMAALQWLGQALNNCATASSNTTAA